MTAPGQAAVLGWQRAVEVAWQSLSTGTPPPGNVGQWIQQASQILEQNGVPASELNANDIWTIIQHESGGNPNAINLWDSNAQAGHPSKGLMQTIASTFNEYSLPGHTDIYNPVDNIIAGSRYAISRYGSISNVPGVVAVNHGRRYVGY
jgi:SLT domain-containing protein